MKHNTTYKTILLIDDDADTLEFLSYNLKKANYKVICAENGEKGLVKAKESKPDLIILDVMMPVLDGYQVCEKLREDEQTQNIVICFLTARGEDFSQITGFDAGADDYLTKPIAFPILLKKIEAIFRRSETNEIVQETKNFIFKDLEINYTTHEVYEKNEIKVLTKKEFALLKLLVSKPGKVFHRDEIYTKVWGNNVIVGDRTIDVHVRKLREKIGDNYISTLKGIGYKFNVN